MDTLNPIPNDQLAPDFTLPDLEGKFHALTNLRNRIVVINFWSAECSWSQRCDLELLPLLEEWGEQIVLLTVASNANESQEMLVQVSIARHLPTVLQDTNQSIADL
jgi:peroxiredoxin